MSGRSAAAGSDGGVAAAGHPDVAEDPHSSAATPEGADFPADAASAVPAGAADATREIEAAWSDIRAKVREFGAAVHALLSGAAVSRVDGDTIVFTHQHAPLAQRLSNPKYVEAVESAVRAVLGRSYGVRWEVGGPGQPAAGARSSAGGAGARGTDGANARPQGGAANGGPARPQNGRAAANPAKSSEPPKFSRPSQARAGEAGTHTPTARSGDADKGSRNAPPDDDIPPPDAPDYPDDPGPVDYSSVGYSDYPSVGYDGVPPASTPEEEREMLAESARPVAPEDRRDPDEVALELLRAELGATRLEG